MHEWRWKTERVLIYVFFFFFFWFGSGLVCFFIMLYLKGKDTTLAVLGVCLSHKHFFGEQDSLLFFFCFFFWLYLDVPPVLFVHTDI
ncbi:hypothetical protein LI328DRAFT_7592 [Trichoderma asperelloides]|nr:hypothetical protein LI328DRAFT_7592 [Trichoderma asperelloides]